MEPFYSSERMCCLARKILSARVKTPRVPYAAMMRCGGGGLGGERPRPLRRRPPAGPPEGQDVSCTTHCADTPALSVRFLVEPFYSSKWSESRTQEMFRYFFGGAFVACDFARFYAASDQAGDFAHVLQWLCNFFMDRCGPVH